MPETPPSAPGMVRDVCAKAGRDRARLQGDYAAENMRAMSSFISSRA